MSRGLLNPGMLDLLQSSHRLDAWPIIAPSQIMLHLWEEDTTFRNSQEQIFSHLHDSVTHS